MADQPARTYPQPVDTRGIADDLLKVVETGLGGSEPASGPIPIPPDVLALVEAVGRWRDYTAHLESNIHALLRMLSGDAPSTCQRCGRAISFIRMPSGKMAPFTPAALNHFADCPNAGAFRR